MKMEKYINDSNKECWKGATNDSEFYADLFHEPEYQFESDNSFAFHTNLGSITVLERMTGFGFRDVESGYRANDGKFWLASGNVDVRFSGCRTIGEAIKFIKDNANTCIGV